MKKIIVAFAGIMVVLSLVWWMRLPAGKVKVVIPPGTSARETAALLKDAGVISSRTFFLQWASLSGNAKRLKAGVYLFSPRESVFSIVAKLAHGRAEYLKVTVPEGYTSAQIAELLAADNIARPEEFLKIVRERRLEGYLFPETYYFQGWTTAEKVADAMTGEFAKNYTVAMSSRAKELGYSDAQIVTLASIIEREAAVDGERPLISAVFHNRLKRKWFLESCATVQYALGKHKEVLSLKDTRIDSPYNTYRRYGLPPGPICNPGSASLKAALYPADTDAMFFVAQSSGTHAFSRYLSEHIRNKKNHRVSRKH